MSKEDMSVSKYPLCNLFTNNHKDIYKMKTSSK